ncbi:hypothetical protein LTR74_010110 [Friedmanniomyces endolithicus]|nr:hypothetical protein LTR74_010110 [Friedmanniomyces endolithicus]
MSDGTGDDDHKRTANLARIRDNQRRSRQRRKEYLSELEVKYRSCEQIGAEASAEIQSAARRVLEENKRLRQLLKQQGLSDAEIDAFLSNRPENTQYPSPTSVALESLIGQRKACRPGSGCDSGSGSAGPEDMKPNLVALGSGSLPPLQRTSQPPLTPYTATHASPQSTLSSGMHTPNTLQHRAIAPPRPHAPPYTMQSLPDLPAIDHGMGFDDSFMWNDQYVPPHTAGPTDTSSCYVAAEAIRTIKPDAGYDLEVELGCSDGRECNVPNNQIFSIMDRYASGPAG